MQKTKMLCLAIFAVLLFGIAGQTRAADPISDPNDASSDKSVITGKVFEKDSNAPMEYANISIFNASDSSLVSGGITNPEGLFKIAKLTPGTYYVEANFIGFNKTRINNITINDNHSNIDLGTILLEASREQIEGVEVVAERSRLEYKVDKKVINVSQDINAAGGSAVDVLENTPSIQVDVEGNVTLRGSSSFTVFIDGRPTSLEGSDALQQIPASALENIEIITNPSAKYDPDGMAGIINLVMKKNILSGFDGIVNVSGSTNESRSMDLTLNHKNKKRNITFGFDTNNRIFNGENDSKRETYYDDYTDFMETDGSRDFNRHGFRFKTGLDLYLSEKTTLGFTANAGKFNFDSERENKNLYYSDPFVENKYTVALEESNRKRNFVDGSVNFLHKYNETGTHKLEGMVYLRKRTGDDGEFQSEIISDENYTPGDEYDLQIRTTEEEESNDIRANLDYTRPLGETGKLEAGLQTRMRSETEDYVFEYFDTDSQEWLDNPDYTSSMDFKRNIHSIYSTYSNKFNAIEVMAGLRGEYTNREIKHIGTDNVYTVDQFNWFPSVHLSNQILLNTQLMASYSRRINRPNGRNLDPFESYVDQYTVRVGNPGLNPEFTNSFDMSVLQRFGSSFISLEAFYRKTKDVISHYSELRDDGILVQTSRNVGDDSSLGGELMANINITKWLLFNSSVSVYQYKLQTAEDDGEIVTRESTNVDGRINTTVKFSSNSRLQLTGNLRGASVSAQGNRDASFFTNLSYRQEFMKRKLSTTLSVRDLFGTGGWSGTNSGTNFYQEYDFAPQPRVVQLTLSFKLNNYKMDNSGGGDGVNEVNFEESSF